MTYGVIGHCHSRLSNPAAHELVPPTCHCASHPSHAHPTQAKYRVSTTSSCGLSLFSHGKQQQAFASPSQSSSLPMSKAGLELEVKAPSLSIQEEEPKSRSSRLMFCSGARSSSFSAPRTQFDAFYLRGITCSFISSIIDISTTSSAFISQHCDCTSSQRSLLCSRLHQPDSSVQTFASATARSTFIGTVQPSSPSSHFHFHFHSHFHHITNHDQHFTSKFLLTEALLAEEAKRHID